MELIVAGNNPATLVAAQLPGEFMQALPSAAEPAVPVEQLGVADAGGFEEFLNALPSSCSDCEDYEMGTETLSLAVPEEIEPVTVRKMSVR